MTRRSFITSLLAVPLAALLPQPKPMWIPIRWRPKLWVAGGYQLGKTVIIQKKMMARLRMTGEFYRGQQWA